MDAIKFTSMDEDLETNDRFVNEKKETKETKETTQN